MCGAEPMGEDSELWLVFAVLVVVLDSLCEISSEDVDSVRRMARRKRSRIGIMMDFCDGISLWMCFGLVEPGA